MENTGNPAFQPFGPGSPFTEDATPQWYIASGSKWVGPLTAADVYQRVISSEITWAHYVWKPGQADWKRICDIDTFQKAVPPVPPPNVQTQVQSQVQVVAQAQAATAAAPSPTLPPAPSSAAVATPKAPEAAVQLNERVWFLNYDQAQFGPFSEEEVGRMLQNGKIHARVYAWRNGMKDWLKLEHVETFSSQFPSSPPVEQVKKQTPPPIRAQDQRKAPRRPLVARLLMASDQEDSVNVGICRDISIGGMQVLTDRVPKGGVGAKIKLNVSPSEGELPPFVAEGLIVRILEDGRGFSFRFERLSADAKKSIEQHISSPE